jgi:hypothetical protein
MSIAVFGYDEIPIMSVYGYAIGKEPFIRFGPSLPVVTSYHKQLKSEEKIITLTITFKVNKISLINNIKFKVIQSLVIIPIKIVITSLDYDRRIVFSVLRARVNEFKFGTLAKQILIPMVDSFSIVQTEQHIVKVQEKQIMEVTNEKL